jgi:alkanesulfonate monooxygenase SsuD/methylene tetrahydromethanopterin reductase-like flavin-dependent oxidoreductase (luciferase family)
MKFGVFYEHQLPQPWHPSAEHQLYQQALEQVEIADGLGFDYLWEVEHHFLEEYSHSSAPEVFLGACSQRTKNIRLGHGICLSPPAYNHPARVAERIGTLDLVSNGRVEWGTGESGSLIEMDGFHVDPAKKNAMWREGVEQAANMMAMRPYPGFDGEFFSMPPRNVVPKPLQKPHPPIWMACSRRESIRRAAANGVGALVFGFVEADQAKIWRDEYYDIIKSDACIPIGYGVNANFATLNGMMIHHDYDEAFRRGLDGFRFFGYSLAHYAVYGEHHPGVTNLWKRFLAIKDDMKETPGSGSIGTPASVRRHLEAYANVGVDQMIFILQSGLNRHDHICEAMELFAKDVMPFFKDAEERRAGEKAAELAPYVEAALARKARMPSLEPQQVPGVPAPGLLRERQQLAEAAAQPGAAPVLPIADPTRGGAIPVASRDAFRRSERD